VTPVEFAAAFYRWRPATTIAEAVCEVCLFVMSLLTADAAEPIAGPTTVVSYREDEYTFTGG
jgi:hypothetical protein